MALLEEAEKQRLAMEEAVRLEKQRLEDERWAAIRKQAEQTDGKWGGQCVRWVKKLLGYPKELNGIVLAKRLVPNTEVPERGVIVITKESRPGTNTGHWELILEVDQEKRQILVTDSNYVAWERVDVRWISMDNKAIKGFYKLTAIEGGE